MRIYSLLLIFILFSCGSKEDPQPKTKDTGIKITQRIAAKKETIESILIRKIQEWEFYKDEVDGNYQMNYKRFGLMPNTGEVQYSQFTSGILTFSTENYKIAESMDQLYEQAQSAANSAHCELKEVEFDDIKPIIKSLSIECDKELLGVRVVRFHGGVLDNI